MVIFANPDDVRVDESESGFEHSARTLEELEAEQVPLVLCSGRTRAEVEMLRQRLGLRHPFVCEHGCAALVPEGYFPFSVDHTRDLCGYHVIEFAKPYSDAVLELQRTARKHGIEVVGFNQMSVDEVAAECGLTLLEARLAKLREFGELFRLLDGRPSTRERMFRALEHARMRCIAGPRYHHVSSHVERSAAVDHLCGLYKLLLGAVLSVGSADATTAFIGGADSSAPPMTLQEWAQTVVNTVRRLRRR